LGGADEKKIVIDLYLQTPYTGSLVSLRKCDGRLATRGTGCPVPSLAMKQSSIESSGRRPNPKAVVSATPVVNRRARARIRTTFFMAISPS
jgi:hypothetical protein